MMLLSVARMLAQQEYHVKVFGRSDDLRVRGAVCFEQMNGFIWVGTSEGLIAFDGKRATLYQVPDPDGMGSYFGRVTTMKQSDDGTIWVGTWRGLYTFDIQRERLVPSHMKGLPAKGGISAMQFAPDGLLWMIVDGQVYVVDVVKKTATLVSERQMSASCLYVSKDGAVWLGSQSGVLYRYDAHHRRMWAYDVKPASADRVSSIVSITEMGTGELALTTGNDGVYLFSPETYESRMLLTHDDTGEPILGHMAVTPDGENLWIGSEHGIIIYRLSDGRVSGVHENRGHPNSLEDDAVHSLFEKGACGWARTSAVFTVWACRVGTSLSSCSKAITTLLMWCVKYAATVWDIYGLVRKTVVCICKTQKLVGSAKLTWRGEATRVRSTCSRCWW